MKIWHIVISFIVPKNVQLFAYWTPFCFEERENFHSIYLNIIMFYVRWNIPMFTSFTKVNTHFLWKYIEHLWAVKWLAGWPGSILGRGRDFSFCHTYTSFFEPPIQRMLGIKQLECEADHSPWSGDEINDTWNFTFTFVYIMMFLCTRVTYFI
jgi:hypothetical protein